VFLSYSLVFSSFFSPLFVPEAFHTGNYKNSPNNVGVSFINKKAPRLGEALYYLFDPEVFE